MKRLMTWLRHLTVLNLLLLGTLVVLGLAVLWPLFDFDIMIPTAAAPKGIGDKKEPGPETIALPPLQEYLVIADQNLFHPDRMIPPLKKDVAEVPRPEFVLYGTMITDNVSVAYLSDKKAVRTTPGRGQRQNGLRLGESLSGYTLREVFPDRVVLVRGDDRIELKVIAAGVKKDRTGGETMAGGTTTPARIPQPMVTPARPAGSPAPKMTAPAQRMPSTVTPPSTSNASRTTPSSFRRTFTPSNMQP